jgi:glycosyltransferase involved in cell wall biosynthesis
VRIAFCHDWNVHYQQELDWQDGLSAALAELRKRGHEVQLFVCGDQIGTVPNPYHDITVTVDMAGAVADYDPDVILCWADFTRPNAQPLRGLGKPIALCFAGGETNTYNTYLFDHVFVESQVYADKLEELGVPHSIAFGTNTDLFQPVDQNKVFDVIKPGTFAAWKRHSLYAQAVQGMKALAVGYMYDDHEQECWQECLRMGVTVLPHASAQVLHRLYAASKVCVITSMSSGGSQRTVLEAMAMNLPLVVTDSDKFDYLTDECFRVEPEAEAIRGAVKALLDGERTINTRQHVLDNWSHLVYADKLEAGLLALL